MYKDDTIGTIGVFPGNFAPKAWLPCDGRSLSISEYSELYDVIGVVYGGNGIDTFNLPDLRGRTAVGIGKGEGMTNFYALGTSGGNEMINLNERNLPSHSHNVSTIKGAITASSLPGDKDNPDGNIPAAVPGIKIYNTSGIVPMGSTDNAFQTETAGKSDPVPMLSPYLATNYFICVAGYRPLYE